MSARRPFSRRAVAALFIRRQHLARPRSRQLSRTNLLRFAEDVGGIQLDSINVLERAHYLTLWSRFGPYDRKAFDRLAYRRRVLFEYWAHAACLVPTGHLAAWRRTMADYRIRHTGWSSWLRKHSRLLGAVEDAIRERGPLGNADFQHKRPKGSESGWWSWKPATHALHYLWMTGKLLVHSRVHFQKRFDLAERLFPEYPTLAPPTAEEFHRWHIERSLHAMGAATDLDLRMYLTFPRLVVGARKKALAGMIARGDVIEIEVADEPSRWLVLARDLPELERSGRTRLAARGTTLLSPFDSFIWHRARTRRLFGFDYRIEVYTPGTKRVHGYYTLPIFHEGQLIGRLDAKNHREAKRLEVRNVHFEDWFVQGSKPPAASWGVIDRDRALAGIADALGSLARFVGAATIDLARATPAALAPPLRRAIAARPEQPPSGTGRGRGKARANRPRTPSPGRGARRRTPALLD